MPEIEFEHISDDRQLVAYCNQIASSPIIGFDTEFVSENRYRPQLCLLQVATPDSLAIIDTIAISDIRPFWDLVCNRVETTIAHAAREEFLFCFREMGKRPKQLVDLQIMAAFVGHEYPAAYGSLVHKILGKRLNKGETRTDWRMRPLAKKQIQYALQDVEFLLPLYTALNRQLVKHNRRDWYLDEIDAWQSRLEAVEGEPQWQRLAGLSKLSRRELGIVRDLFIWREAAAKERERSPRRVLPDDLLLEIAKRGDSTLSRLTAIRGLTQRVNAKLLPAISEVIEATLALPDLSLPDRIPAAPSPSIGILGQFLTTSLNLVCHEKEIAPGLVATAQDIRNLAAWKMGQPVDDTTPSLVTGWRGPLLDELFELVLSGKVALRVVDASSPNPVRLEKWPE